jgi:hypothetical protein
VLARPEHSWNRYALRLWPGDSLNRSSSSSRGRPEAGSRQELRTVSLLFMRPAVVTTRS